MTVLIIGATGLLGSQCAQELVARGHTVRGLALPPAPEGALLPPMELTFGSYLDMTDGELSALMAGCEGLVFAAGVDERLEGKPPIYDFFVKYNNTPLRRLLAVAKATGVKHVVVCGSYFTHFAATRPEWDLARHPYIKSRLEQQELALSFAGPGFDVAVLGIPYIFGAQPGRKPVWTFLVKMLRRMPFATFYPDGGTAMITARQTGQALAGAVERNRGGQVYPLGWVNRSWRDMLTLFHQGMGVKRPVVTIPAGLFTVFAAFVVLGRKLRGVEGGLNLVRFATPMADRMYIDRALGAEPLGVTDDDIDAAILDSVRASVRALDKDAPMIGMKGE